MPNLQSKIFQKFFLYQVCWSLNFSSFGVCPGTNFVWLLQIWGQKFFRIFSFTECSKIWYFFGNRWSRHQLFLVTPNLRSKIFQNFFLYLALWFLNFISFREGLVSALAFFGHSKFYVKNFSEFFPLPNTLDSEFFGEGGPNTNFFGHVKFENTMFQNFFLYQVLWTLNLSSGCPGTNFFWSCQIWGPNFFRIFSVTEHSQLNILEGGVQIPNFFSHSKFETKNFSEFFPLLSALNSKIFLGVGGLGTNFFGHAKFEVKNCSEFFPLLSALNWIFRGGGPDTNTPNLRSKSSQNFFLYQALWILNLLVGGIQTLTFFSYDKFETKNFSEFFPLPSALDSEIFWGAWSGHQLFLVTPNLRSKNFQNFFLYLVLWSLNFSWFQAEGWSRQHLFLVTPNLRSKNFQNFLFSEYSGLWICWGGSSHQLFFLICGQNFFFFYWAIWSLNLSWFGERRDLCTKFFSHAKFEVKNYSEFFPLLSTVVSQFFLSWGFPGMNIFLSLQIWGKKFFRIFSFTEFSGLWIFQVGGSGHQLFWSC